MDKDKLITYLNMYFGYEIQNMQQFESIFDEEFLPKHRTNELFDFLKWLEKKDKIKER